MKFNHVSYMLVGYIAGMLMAIAISTYHHKRMPRLVGYNCFQAPGPLYAEEEDHFPPCEKIERSR
jgi:hypothetical protein